MQKPNLIIYESQMKTIIKHCLKSKEPSTAEQMMMAMFNYYLEGEVYEGENDVVDTFMDSVYPLVDKQQENFIKKVESVISNEDFSALALSGNFSTQKELAEYITAHYGAYTQSAVSKRLRTLGITLVKPSSKPSSPVLSASAVEDKIRELYNTYTDSWGFRDSDAKQKIMKDYNISSAELERILGGNTQTQVNNPTNTTTSTNTDNDDSIAQSATAINKLTKEKKKNPLEGLL